MAKGVLVDLTKCVGCGSCTVACKMYNKTEWTKRPALPDSEGERLAAAITDANSLGIEKKYAPSSGENAELSAENWTVIQKRRFDKETGKCTSHQPGKDITALGIDIHIHSADAVSSATKTDGSEVWRYIKRQCLHCKEPACASACFAKAFQKTEAGPVVYYPQLCVGCRYCMLACPFSIPKFEWHKPIPTLEKCMMCSSRVNQNEAPACVSVCPTGVMKFGDHDELLKEAKEIIAADKKYEQHIYGEEEAGGTSWIYISDKPFAEMGFKTTVPKRSIPSYTNKYMHFTPVFAAAWAAVLAGLYIITGIASRRMKINKKTAKEGTEENVPSKNVPK
ncbi:MAG: 4Fe-4S dicluster domain-containing protein [Planctomycetaceae bacterium]|nr:4Fe-4S dicluster domain-containing protein [Planctomycetaceae bacterium]